MKLTLPRCAMCNSQTHYYILIVHQLNGYYLTITHLVHQYLNCLVRRRICQSRFKRVDDVEIKSYQTILNLEITK